MHNSRDPGRRYAVPDAPQPGQRERPRGQLVVEVWNPPPLAQTQPREVRRESRRAEPTPHRFAGGRTIAAAVVLAIHAAAIALWMTPFPVHRPPSPEPLVLLTSLPTVRPPLDLGAVIPPPNLMRVALVGLPPPSYPRPAAEMAISISASTDVMIRDVGNAETEHMRLDCRRESASRIRSSTRTSELILLVRVEKDGRISDSRIESASNMPAIDESVRLCLLARTLPPSTVNGATVTSWQRLHWPPP
jgi:hypothetical protein